MDDKHPDAILVDLGGKSRRLKLGPAAFRLAAKRHGTTITTTELASPTLDVLAQLVWIGLLPDEPDLTEDEVLVWLAQTDDESAVLGRVMQGLAGLVDGIQRATAQGPRPFVPPGKKR